MRLTEASAGPPRGGSSGIATGPEALALLAARLLGPGPAWRDQEDARVAHADTVRAALALLLSRMTPWLVTPRS